MATSTATVTYKVLQGMLTPAAINLIIRQQKVAIPSEILTFLGVTVTSDTTATNASDATRTIVFNLLANTDFKKQFPDTGDQVGPFQQLMRGIIEASSGCQVICSTPVIA